jgi:hypothetical protein
MMESKYTWTRNGKMTMAWLKIIVLCRYIGSSRDDKSYNVCNLAERWHSVNSWLVSRRFSELFGLSYGLQIGFTSNEFCSNSKYARN